MVTIDLTGKIFGRLKVIRCVDGNGNGIRWECKCACGNTTIVDDSDLRNGKIKSCGCINRNIAVKKISSRNKSGVTGVHWVKATGKWRATMNYAGKRHFSGDYDNKEDAIAARLEAERKYRPSVPSPGTAEQPAGYGNRICQQCGIKFDGKTIEKYCPKCKKLRLQYSHIKYTYKIGQRKTLPAYEEWAAMSNDIHSGRNKRQQERTCQRCGRAFLGDGRNKYCPECAVIRKKERDAADQQKYKERRKDAEKNIKMKITEMIRCRNE